MAAVIYRTDIYIHDSVPFVSCHILKQSDNRNTGIINKNVNITKMPVNLIKHFHSSVIVTYVASEAFAAYTQISYLFLYIFKQFTVFCTINKNIIFFMIIFRSTFFSKSKCNSPANSSWCPCYNNSLFHNPHSP